MENMNIRAEGRNVFHLDLVGHFLLLTISNATVSNQPFQHMTRDTGLLGCGDEPQLFITAQALDRCFALERTRSRHRRLRVNERNGSP